MQLFSVKGCIFNILFSIIYGMHDLHFMCDAFKAQYNHIFIDNKKKWELK